MTLSLIRIYERGSLVKTENYKHAKFPFEYFNPVQSGLIDVYNKDANCIVAASTSSGKTLCFEMFAAYEVRVNKKKVIYLSPLKSLSQEKLDDWLGEHHFSDLKVSICTGDYRMTSNRIKELNEADIIIMTSEMLNSFSRNYKSDKNQWLQQVGLVACDESHQLGEEGRGDHQESGIMKFTEFNKGRILLLSATMPNVDEIGRWLHHLNGHSTYLLESTYRPCKLNIHYEQYWDEFNYDENERKKVFLAIQLVKKYPDDKFICFVHTKRTGEMLHGFLEAAGIQCDYHNANLNKDKRIKIEKAFREDPKLRVIVATSGLAQGCYKHGSNIQLANGLLKKVEKLKKNDEVLSFDGKKIVPSKVLQIENKDVQKSYFVVLQGGKECEVTEDHLFYAAAERNSPDWVNVSKLKKGDWIAVLEFPADTKLKDLLLSDLTWKRIKTIEVKNGGLFTELEINNTHNYFGQGMLSHNCNMPARRVIILGLHRGLQEVKPQHIIQMAGRAGRPQYDKEGDAYVLLPKKKFEKYKEYLEQPIYIQSQMTDPKVLAFHIVSEIHHGTIRSNKDIHNWYKRTLAHFQKHQLDNEVVEEVIEKLLFSGCIKEEDNILSTTVVGTVASMFYYSPFDVSDLYKNFTNLFKAERGDDETWLAMALGAISSNYSGIVNNVEREEMKEFFNEVSRCKIQKEPFKDGILKAGYCYKQLLEGRNSNNLNNVMRLLQMDFGRTSEVLTALDTMSSKWEQKGFFKDLALRIAYGIPVELVDLCKINTIGKIKAKRLYSAGMTQLKHVNDTPTVIKALGCSKKIAEEIIAEAKAIVLKGDHD